MKDQVRINKKLGQFILSGSIRFTSRKLIRESLTGTFEWKTASEESQISRNTLKKVMFAFEALFLIRTVPCEGDLRRPVFFLEDQGMATWLSEPPTFRTEEIVRGLYGNLRQELHYDHHLNGQIFQYRTRNDVTVPLVFRSKLGIVGMLCTKDPIPTPKHLESASSFLKAYPKSKIVIAHGGKEITFRGPNQFWIPYWKLT